MKFEEVEPSTTVTVGDLIDLRQVEQLTGLSMRTLSAYSTAGKIPSMKFGYSRLYSRPEIVRWNRARVRRKRLLSRSATETPVGN
jgi:hypothetical protein